MNWKTIKSLELETDPKNSRIPKLNFDFVALVYE